MTSGSSNDLFLSPTERFLVWQVKVAERPELVPVYTQNDSCDNDEPAMTDGCDLHTWRQHELVDQTGETIQTALNIGTGCTLLRRESQLPLALSSRATRRWQDLQKELLEPQPLTASITSIDYATMIDTPCHAWFERQNVPVIFDKSCTRDWSAMQTCTFASLLQRFGSIHWRFSDLHAETMTLQTYKKYTDSVDGGLLDDAPLAVYDSQFHLDERACILDEYTVFSCFAGSDVFDELEYNENDVECTTTTAIVDEHKTADTASSCTDDDTSPACRPPYRWILIGMPRSGTGLHVDPLGTHAWVTLIQGCKRWVLFHPTAVPKHEIGLSRDAWRYTNDDNDDSDIASIPQTTIPSAIWFSEWYPRIRQKYGHNNNNNCMIEIVQYAGETVYVPAHWPHIVLNLELSVAITHNYATVYPCVDKFYEAVQLQEPDLAKQLLPVLLRKKVQEADRSKVKVHTTDS